MRDLGTLASLAIASLAVAFSVGGCDVHQSSAADTDTDATGSTASPSSSAEDDDDGGPGPSGDAGSAGPGPADPSSGSTGGSGPTDETGDPTGDSGLNPDGLPTERYGALHVADGRLRAEDGSAIQLRGVSSMWLNWEYDGYAESLPALEFMRDEWGLTVIRAAMGVDAEGAYLANPDKALSQVRTIVDNAVAAGVYVIIDWHDHHAEQHQAQAIQFFEMMTAEYGHLPNVLYEPYNEPLQVSWSGTVKPYHEAVVTAIRAGDPDNVIILGSPNWSSSVDEAAADPVVGTNLVYTLHFYACSHGQEIRNRGTVALSQGLALFATEWAATHADGGLDGLVCESEALAWRDWMNQNQVSWTAWKLDNCQPDSSCILAPGASVAGGWGPGDLGGHGAYVRERMLE
ncbi:MAG: glycoside hydrolase family 5 protein [Nannocystales bacterium]